MQYHEDLTVNVCLYPMISWEKSTGVTLLSRRSMSHVDIIFTGYTGENDNIQHIKVIFYRHRHAQITRVTLHGTSWC